MVELINPADVGRSIMQSFQGGMQLGQQHAGQNALSQYAMNPDDPKAFQGLARHRPEMAMQVRQQQQAEQKKAMMGQLAAAAAQGDPRALAGLWAQDPDLAYKLDERQAKEAVKGFEFLGNAAYDIIQRPPEQQAAMFEQYIDQAIAMGYDGLAQYKGKFSPQLLNSFVAKVDGMKEFMSFQQPKYVPVGEGGLSGFQYGQPIQQGGQPQDFGGQPPPQQHAMPTVATPQDAMKLPPGTKFRMPDGRIGTVPGGAGGNTSGGFPDPLAPR